MALDIVDVLVVAASIGILWAVFLLMMKTARATFKDVRPRFKIDRFVQ